MTRTRKLMAASIATVLLLSIVLNMVVYAPPPSIPMTVYGTVYIDIIPAGAGVTVYAKYEGAELDSCLTLATGIYVLEIAGPAEGSLIELWVEDELVETVTLNYGATESNFDLYSTGAPPDNVAPVANAGADLSGETGVELYFDGSGSYDDDGIIVLWEWDFDDGGTWLGETTPHEFAAAGEYTVTLTVTDDDDATDSDTALVTITDPGTPPTNVAPVADADGPYSDYVGEAISFDGSGSTDSDGTITSYAWTFGDTGTATTESPSHTYTAPGTYPVTLTVTDNDGATHMDTTTAIVGAIVATPDFSIDYVSANTGDKGDTLTVTGSGVTAGTTVNVYWDYASGTGIHLLNTTEGDPDGTFELEIDIPSDTVGPHYLWATDVSTGETVSWGPFTMVPKISLSPSAGLVDDEITIKGYGYTAEANLTFTIGTANLMVSPSDVETDEDGYFTVTFDVPDNAYGIYLVRAEDFYEIWDDVNFTLGASITLSLEEGPMGIVVEVEGRGWTEVVLHRLL